jgi:hypothetical protein
MPPLCGTGRPLCIGAGRARRFRGGAKPKSAAEKAGQCRPWPWLSRIGPLRSEGDGRCALTGRQEPVSDGHLGSSDDHDIGRKHDARPEVSAIPVAVRYARMVAHACNPPMDGRPTGSARPATPAMVVEAAHHWWGRIAPLGRSCPMPAGGSGGTSEQQQHRIPLPSEPH